MNCRRQQGFSLIELVLVITMAGILMTFAVPKTSITVENTHVNQGVAGMRSIWLAQRRYRMEYGDFASSLEILVERGFVQEIFAKKEDPFGYEVATSAQGKMRITATRSSGSAWRGRLTLNEMGKIGGSVTDGGGHEVKP